MDGWMVPVPNNYTRLPNIIYLTVGNLAAVVKQREIVNEPI
jgi:hypothetical protein